MTTENLHPNHLRAGDTVGAWQIVQELGVGGTSRIFKVQRNGRFYTMKMALSPLTHSEEEEEKRPAEEQAQAEGVYRRLAREVSALFTYASHPHLLRVYAVDFWPDPDKGYPFLVTKFVDGDTWHAWRWRTRPDARALVDTFIDVVRTVGVLHARGVYHRDLKAENLLIRRSDGRAFVIDFGNARLPGAFTKTLGLPDGALHLVPPELLAYIRGEAWKQGERFNWGVAADLYTLGVLLYESLTDHHPFDPELTDEELVVAIASVRPTPPHTLNPRAPRALSDIALRLLEKRPEDRYADTEALLQALEQTRPEHASPEWKVRLLERASQGIEEPSAPVPEAPREAPEEEAPPEHRSTPRRPSAARRRWVLLACVTLAGLVLWLTRSTLAPSLKGSPPMPASAISHDAPTPRPSLLAAWLCAALGLGCPGAQVKPPEPDEACPLEAREAMEKELHLDKRSSFVAHVDIRQPGEQNEVGLYQEGPLLSRIVTHRQGPQELPVGTLLHGRLWTGPGIYDQSGRPAVIGRYTLAVLPDGRKFPVCIVLGDEDGRPFKLNGSTPEATVLGRTEPLHAVWRWP